MLGLLCEHHAGPGWLAIQLGCRSVGEFGDATPSPFLLLVLHTPALFTCLLPAVDGEKDPRCLLLSFEAIRALLALYHRQPEEALCRDRLEVR